MGFRIFGAICQSVNRWSEPRVSVPVRNHEWSKDHGATDHGTIQLSALVRGRFGSDFVSVHTEVGENGHGIQFIRKNPTQQGTWDHAYEGSMVETRAIARLAKAAGKSYGVGVIIVTHGESDSGNSQYENALHQLWQDYNTDIPVITGQTNKILMILSQQHGLGNHSAATLAQWKIAVDYAEAASSFKRGRARARIKSKSESKKSLRPLSQNLYQYQPSVPATPLCPPVMVL